MSKAIVFEYPLTIIEKHLDFYKHVNNATYLDLYEEARWDFITRRGYGFDHIQATGHGPIILECHLTFRKELVNREKIIITSQYMGKKSSMVGMVHQEIIKSNGKIASTLDVDVALFDLTKRKLLSPTKEWLDALGAV